MIWFYSVGEPDCNILSSSYTFKISNIFNCFPLRYA